MRNFFKILIIFSAILLINAQIAHAQSSNVDHVAGKLERLQERINLILTFSKESKFEKHQKLLNKRLNEIIYVSNNNLLDEFEETTSRYAAYAGRLTDFVANNNLTDKQEAATQLLNEHKKIIQPLIAKQEYESAYWLLLKHDSNSLDSLISRINSL